MFKIVEGTVKAIPSNEFLKPMKEKRQVKVKSFETVIQQTFWIGTKQIQQGLAVDHCKTDHIITHSSSKHPSSGYRSFVLRDSWGFKQDLK